MMLASNPSVAAGASITVRQQVVELPGGHRVGVHVAGAGVPMVFLHGIGLSGAMYSGLLGGLPQLGVLSTPLAPLRYVRLPPSAHVARPTKPSP